MNPKKRRKSKTNDWIIQLLFSTFFQQKPKKTFNAMLAIKYWLSFVVLTDWVKEKIKIHDMQPLTIWNHMKIQWHCIIIKSIHRKKNQENALLLCIKQNISCYVLILPVLEQVLFIFFKQNCITKEKRWKKSTIDLFFISLAVAVPAQESWISNFNWVSLHIHTHFTLYKESEIRMLCNLDPMTLTIFQYRSFYTATFLWKENICFPAFPSTAREHIIFDDKIKYSFGYYRRHFIHHLQHILW